MNITDDIELTSDKYQWIVTEWHIAKKGKNAGKRVKKRTSYHSNFQQCAMYLLDKTGKAATDVTGLLRAFKEGVDGLEQAIQVKASKYYPKNSFKGEKS